MISRRFWVTLTLRNNFALKNWHGQYFDYQNPHVLLDTCTSTHAATTAAQLRSHWYDTYIGTKHALSRYLHRNNICAEKSVHWYTMYTGTPCTLVHNAHWYIKCTGTILTVEQYLHWYDTHTGTTTRTSDLNSPCVSSSAARGRYSRILLSVTRNSPGDCCGDINDHPNTPWLIDPWARDFV